MDLNKDYTEFFTDHVKRIWDHDSIHESLVHPARPRYEKYLTGDVAMDMKKVWSWPKLNIYFPSWKRSWRQRWSAGSFRSGYTCSPRWAYMQAPQAHHHVP